MSTYTYTQTSVFRRIINKKDYINYLKTIDTKLKQNYNKGTIENPVGEATMGIRIATDIAWRHAPSGQQDLSKNKAYSNAISLPHDAKTCNG